MSEYPLSNLDFTNTTAPTVLTRAVAGYIGEQDFTHDIPDGRKYASEPILKAFVYRETLRAFDSYHGLSTHLRTQPGIASALGFQNDTPDRDTLRTWWVERIPQRTKEVLEIAVDTHYRPTIGRLLADAGLKEGRTLLDIPQPEPEPSDITPERKQTAIKHNRALVYDLLEFDRAENTTFEADKLLDLQAEVSREQDFIQKTVEDHWDRGEDAPWPRTFFNAVKNREADDWHGIFEQVYDRQLEAAAGARLFDRPVDVYVDSTVIPFYLDRSVGKPEGIRGGAQSNGTYYGYHHFTLCAQVRGRSILLATFEYTPDDSMMEGVQYLVKQAEQYVDIDTIHLDSAFVKAALMVWLDERGHKFIMQYPKRGDRIKRKLAAMSGTHDATEYTVNSPRTNTRTTATLLAEPDYDNMEDGFSFDGAGGGQAGLGEFGGGMDMESASLNEIDDQYWKARRPYITNWDIEGIDPEARIKQYKRRWRIETKYRVIKNDFLGRTTSRDFDVRTFFWLFACMLYNAWVLLDAFLRLDYPDLVPEDRPVMPARNFAKRFFQVDHG